MRGRNHFVSPKLFRFNRGAYALGKTGWLIPGIVFNYCARIACLSMSCGIEIVFPKKDIKKELCKSMFAKPNADLEEKLSRAGFSGNAKKKCPAKKAGRIPIIYSILQKPFCGVLRPIFDTSPFRSALQ